MPRRKAKYTNLRKLIVADLKERGAYREIDDHLIDLYVNQVETVDALQAEIDGDGVVTKGERGSEFVANPALVRLPSAQAQLNSMQKALGIGPYGRKLTTGQDVQKPKTESKVSQLRPRSRNKAN